MNQSIVFSPDQSDALRELLNIAMGQAADSLARALDSYIHISIPKTDVIEARSLNAALADVMPGSAKVSAVRQAFFNDLSGEAIVIFDTHDHKELVGMMGYNPEDEVAEIELMLDLTNILVGACLTGFAQQIKAEIGYAPPKILAIQAPIKQVLNFEEQVSWTHSLIIKLHFTLTEGSFSCELLMLMPEECVDKVRNAVDSFLGSL